MPRVKNLMKGLKHADTGFFIWIYYPSSKHEKGIIHDFLDAVREFPVNNDNIDSYFNRGSVYIDKPFHDDITNAKIVLSIQGLATSAFPSGQTPYNPPFERKDMLSVFFQNESLYSRSAYEDPATIRAFLHYIDLFVRHFNPVFGHGHKDLNKWVDTHNVSPPPETRIWPYNIYNLDAYESLLEDRLNDFIAVHGDEWSLRRIVDNIVELRMEDLSTSESAIGPEVTRAILGEGDNLLVPKVGYPPPERWW